MQQSSSRQSSRVAETTRVDSVSVRDTLRIEMRGDTVWSIRTVWRERLRHDTTEIRDTLWRSNTRIETEEKRVVDWRGVVGIALPLGAVTALVIIRITRKRNRYAKF